MCQLASLSPVLVYCTNIHGTQTPHHCAFTSETGNSYYYDSSSCSLNNNNPAMGSTVSAALGNGCASCSHTEGDPRSRDIKTDRGIKPVRSPASRDRVPSIHSLTSCSTIGRMTSGSEHGSTSGGWKWSGPPGEHSPYPIDNPPYGGPQLLYCFVDVMLTYKIMKNEVNLGPPAVATDIEKYLYLIDECYAEGFVLDKFVRVPGIRMTTDIADWTTQQPYQAILTRIDDASYTPCDYKEQWKLKIEKRILSTKTLAFDQMDQENDLINTIHKYAADGCRLVCAEPVGYVRSMSANEQYGIMGVELFFNVPLQRNAPRFTYHAVTVAAQYQIVPDATQTVQQVVCNADFLGQLRLFLNQGWKLVDICIDTTAIADAYRMRSTSKLVETIWIFEKETNRLFDDTPLFEGVIIEYLHRVKRRLSYHRQRLHSVTAGQRLPPFQQQPQRLTRSVTTSRPGSGKADSRNSSSTPAVPQSVGTSSGSGGMPNGAAVTVRVTGISAASVGDRKSDVYNQLYGPPLASKEQPEVNQKRKPSAVAENGYARVQPSMNGRCVRDRGRVEPEEGGSGKATHDRLPSERSSKAAAVGVRQDYVPLEYGIVCRRPSGHGRGRTGGDAHGVDIHETLDRFTLPSSSSFGMKTPAAVATATAAAAVTTDAESGAGFRGNVPLSALDPSAITRVRHNSVAENNLYRTNAAAVGNAGSGFNHGRRSHHHPH